MTITLSTALLADKTQDVETSLLMQNIEVLAQDEDDDGNGSETKFWVSTESHYSYEDMPCGRHQKLFLFCEISCLPGGSYNCTPDGILQTIGHNCTCIYVR